MAREPALVVSAITILENHSFSAEAIIHLLCSPHNSYAVNNPEKVIVAYKAFILKGWRKSAAQTTLGTNLPPGGGWKTNLDRIAIPNHRQKLFGVEQVFVFKRFFTSQTVVATDEGLDLKQVGDMQEDGGSSRTAPAQDGVGDNKLLEGLDNNDDDDYGEDGEVDEGISEVEEVDVCSYGCHDSSDDWDSSILYC